MKRKECGEAIKSNDLSRAPASEPTVILGEGSTTANRVGENNSNGDKEDRDEVYHGCVNNRGEHGMMCKYIEAPVAVA